MKSLLVLFLMLSNNHLLEATELDNISIITPTSYSRPSSSSQTIKSKLKVGVGDLINTDVIAEVKSKIAPYKKDLAGYFSNSAELDSFINKILVDGKNSTLGNDLADAKLIKFYDHLGNNLIGGIADKILKTEGVDDPARRSLWIKKILAPFNACVDRAKNALYDANHCIDALSASLVQSTGVALVYELSRQKLSSTLPEGQRLTFNTQQTVFYKSCMKNTQGEASDVKRCALAAMGDGLSKITDQKLSKTINDSASSPTAAKAIKLAVWPSFNSCTQKVGKTQNDKQSPGDQFMECIDTLVQNTGVQLVQDKVINNITIKSNFSKPDAAKIALEESEHFKACIVDQKKNNKRKDGMLDTDKCENLVTNEITYKVVLKSLGQAASDAFKTDKEARTKATNDAERFINQCWSNDQTPKAKEICLRKAILSFSQSVASVKLDKAIPEELKSKNEIKSTALKNFSSCLEKNLPSNISEAKNLSAQTSLCSNKLTVAVAQRVAQDSVHAKAIEQKMSEADANQLVKTYVDQNFINCIGSAPSDDKLSKCSGELKKNAAITLASSQIRTASSGKITPLEADALITNLVKQKFSTCLGNNPSDSRLDECVGDLTKSATRSIVLAYEKKQIKEQLNADVTPSKLKSIEDSFIACTEKKYQAKKVSKAMDECTKNFALEFARTLGDLKLNNLLKTILGTQGYEDRKAEIDGILEKYNACLDDLKKFTVEDGVLDKLTFCTDGLERRGINFVTSTVNTWMTTEQKDAATIMVKNEFANFIPCLGALLPAAPYTQALEKNVDSVLKPVALLLSQYIEYSPGDAKRTLDEISRKLATDFKDVATNPASRRELIDLLYKNGALDQFLKSLVRAQVKESFEQTSEAELPIALRSTLLDKDNFDKMFSSPDGQAIKEMVMDKILKPVLMEQASLKSPLMQAGMDSVKDKVIKMLVYSPNFGEKIIKNNIQTSIDGMGGFTKFFAKTIYGKNSLDWEKVRITPAGKKAEDYIKENILLPTFNGQKLSAEDTKKKNGEAEKLVKNAVQSYEN